MNEPAEAQVEAFIDALKRRYGLSDHDISGMLEQITQLQRRAAFARKMGEWTAQVIISVLVTAFFSGFAWAIVQFIRSMKA